MAKKIDSVEIPSFVEKKLRRIEFLGMSSEEEPTKPAPPPAEKSKLGFSSEEEAVNNPLHQQKRSRVLGLFFR